MCYSILIEQDLKKLELTFDAKVDHPAFERYQGMSQRDNKRFKPIASNPRIYPNYFAPIITMKGDERVITPMRYRVRPNASEKEVPSKYNMFNARVDSLQSRQSWRAIFMRNHGVISLKGFYEWVTREGRKKVIYFHKKSGKLINTPVIFDTWLAPDRSEGFASFAIITRDPPPEVLAAGHDRCPIVLPDSLTEPWLRCHGKPNEMLGAIDQAARGNFVFKSAEP